MTAPQLTDRQKTVLSFIRQHITDRGIPPTIQEIADELGIRANAANDHVQALKRKNVVGIARKFGEKGRLGSVCRGIYLVNQT